MGIGRRIADLFRSRAAEDDVDALSERLESTYREQLGHLRQVRRGLAEMTTSRRRVEVRLAQQERESESFEATARAAVERGDDVAARSALTQQQRLRKGIADLRERHAVLREDEAELQRTADELERRIEDFRLRKDTLSARHAAASARSEINAAGTGIASTMSDAGRAMEAAERHTRELEAQADAVDELVAEGVLGQPGESADDRARRQFDAALGDAAPGVGNPPPVERGRGDGPDQISS